MYEIDIYFIGGNRNKITETSEKVVYDFMNWLDDETKIKSFSVLFKNNRVEMYRKEAIAYVNITEIEKD